MAKRAQFPKPNPIEPGAPPGCAICGKAKPNDVAAVAEGWSLSPEIRCPEHTDTEPTPLDEA